MTRHPTNPLRRLLALAVALLVAPTAALATNRNFAAGSILIPAQLEWQNPRNANAPDGSGVIGAYGLVYSLLLNNAARIAANQKPITVYWAISPSKRSMHRCAVKDAIALPTYATFNDLDGCDVTVQSAAGRPVVKLGQAGNEIQDFTVRKTTYDDSRGRVGFSAQSITVNAARTVVNFGGGVWIIDATDKQEFLDALRTVPQLAQYHANGTGDAKYVELYQAKIGFTAPVARSMRDKPPVVAVINTGGQTNFLDNYMSIAGLATIPNAKGTPDANGTAGLVYDELTTASLSSNVNGFANGRLNRPLPTNAARTYYELMWATDSVALNADQLGNIARFADAGNSIFAQADFISVLENSGAPLHTSAGVDGRTNALADDDDCTDRSIQNGVGVVFFSNENSSCYTYHVESLREPYAQTGDFEFDDGQGNFKAYKPKAGSVYLPGVRKLLSYEGYELGSVRHKDDDPERGLVVYLAGHKYDQAARFWGLRIVLNTLLDINAVEFGVELARSEPVGYKDTSVATPTARVYQGTYVELPVDLTMSRYNPGSPKSWKFPYTAGHLYEYEATAVSSAAGGQAFSANSRWDADDQMPAPGARTMFTWLGGSARYGWRRVAWDHDEVEGGCTTTGGDNKCDLAKEIAACPSSSNLLGVPSVDAVEARNLYGRGTNLEKLAAFIQQTRGFCYATNADGSLKPEPGAPAECASRRQRNVARLGGIDHGAPAVVGPSRYVTQTAPNGRSYSDRPVVAFAGARDGMLHAFYVSGGANWPGIPAGATAGRELWAVVPPGQICGLADNTAMLDAAMNVVDVFDDFPTDRNGNGVIDWQLTGAASERPDGRSDWRTVLLVAAGPGGSELFTVDVTDPLRPVLLWHVRGAKEKDGRWDVDGDGVLEAGEAMDPDVPATYALRWSDPARYRAVPDASAKFGKLDFRNMGKTYGTAIAKMWTGTTYRYVGYFATNAADYTNVDSPEGYRGLDLFGVDVVTGEKLWHWQKRYSLADATGTVIADNDIPGRPALVDADLDGSVDRVYVGDLEGRLWELDAKDGRNVNYYPVDGGGDADGWYSFPLFGSQRMVGAGATDATKNQHRINGGLLAQQPLTSPIGLGRFTETQLALEPYLKGRLAIVQGTMGIDWPISPFEAADVYVIPVAPDGGTRVEVSPEVELSANPELKDRGVLLPAASWRIPLDVGERVYGIPRIANNRVVINTAFGALEGALSESAVETGKLRVVGKDAASSSTTVNTSKSFGGVLVFEGRVFVTSLTGLKQLGAAAAAEISDDAVGKQPWPRVTPAFMKTHEPVPLK